MSQATLHPPARVPVRFERLTVDQYDRMIESGILQSGTPCELLDGFLVGKDRSKKGEDPLTVGDDHTWAVQGLVELNVKLAPLGCYMRAQAPIRIPPINEPEPDGAIVLGTRDDYRKRKPIAGEITCVIEVADSSLRADRTTKLALYANAGIGQYVIINLVNKAIEVYTEPEIGLGRYGKKERLHKRDKVALLAAGGKSLVVPVKALLP